MKRRRPWMGLGDFARWETYNRRRSTIKQSKIPFAKRMEEEWELEKKMQREKEKKRTEEENLKCKFSRKGE